MQSRDSPVQSGFRFQKIDKDKNYSGFNNAGDIGFIEGQYAAGAFLDFYLRQISRYGELVLELTCGSGRLTIPLREQGIDITDQPVKPTCFSCGMVQLRSPVRQYALLVPILLVWTAVSSTLFYPLAELIQQSLFDWWPGWLNLSAFFQDPAQYSNSTIWTIVALSAVLNIIVPITEELYFRSYLLPRISFAKKWTPWLSAGLFSLYHFWLPWDFFGRIVTLMPVIYLVQRKQNVYLSIFVHSLLNSIGTLGLLAIVLGQRL